MGRLAIFDMDGTLVDSRAHILLAMAGAFDHANRVAPPSDRLLSVVGLSLPVAMAQLVPDASAAMLDRLCDGYRATFAAHRGTVDTPLFPGAQAVLDALSHQGVTLAVATGKSRRGLDHLLACHGLQDRFASTQVADDHPSKPDPSMVLRVLHETGCAARDAVMIGDTSFDIEMGRAAGTHTIGVSWGYHPRDMLDRAAPDRIVDDFAQVPLALAQVWGDADV